MAGSATPESLTAAPTARLSALESSAARSTATSSVNAAVPQELSDWIDSLLVKDPAERVASAAAAWEALDEILFGVLGPRWQRTSSLPAAVGVTTPVKRFESAFIDPARIAEHLPERPATVTGVATSPTEPGVPDVLPGPYTPPPGDAVVSAELRALDPVPDDSYVSVDLDALNPPPPRPRGDSAVVTPRPDLPPAKPKPAAEPKSDDSAALEPSPQRDAESAAEPSVTEPPPTLPPVASVTAPEPPPSHRGRALAIGAVVATVAVVAAVALSGGGDETPPPAEPSPQAADGAPAPTTTNVSSRAALVPHPRRLVDRQRVQGARRPRSRRRRSRHAAQR